MNDNFFGFFMIVVWIIGFLLSLGISGVVIWGIIKLVNHFIGG